MLLNLKILSILVFVFGITATGTAQQTESLLIGPGDLLQIQVVDTPELDQAARVTDAGTIPLTYGGDVKIVSKTPAQAARTIEKALVDGSFMRHPRVTVAVTDFATAKVSVMGEVKVPGAYSIQTDRSVVDVLALAGGLTEGADRKIVIERHETRRKDAYFVSNHAQAALEEAVVIHPGDTIYVPKAGVVYVLGDVGRPGGYTMTNTEAQITALQLVARAGGTNHSAVPSKAILMRKTATGYTDTPIELSRMQKGKAPDVTLEANDVIYVPFSYLRNFGMQATGIVSSLGSAAVYHF
jgi:polysaccharide export outer membrane protein